MVSVTHWLWIDLEMTGLDPDKERIIELAAILTDPQMNEIDRLGPIVVHQSNDLLDAMDDWNQKHHGRSGLIDLVKNSKVSEKQCEEMVMDLLRKNKYQKTSPFYAVIASGKTGDFWYDICLRYQNTFTTEC